MLVLSMSLVFAQTQIFTRRVEQFSSKPGHLADVSGQDSARMWSHGGKTYFVFGDTFLDGRPGFTENAVASTEDMDPSDGLDGLVYFEDNNLRAALPRWPGEFSVWLSGGYEVDGQIYVHYYRVAAAQPHVPSNYGIARMISSGGDFEPLGIEITPDHPLHPNGVMQVFDDPEEPYLYFTSRISGGAGLLRVLREDHLDFEAFERLTPEGWQDQGTMKNLLPTSGQASISFNEYLGRYMGVASRAGFLIFSNQINLLQANELEGPWSSNILFDGTKTWPQPESFRTYQARHWAPFEKERGRIIYSLATRQTGYNVHLYESHLDYVNLDFEPTYDYGTHLRKKEKTTMAFEFVGNSYSNTEELLTKGLRLTLGVENPFNKAKSFVFRVEVGVPNFRALSPGLSDSLQAFDLTRRERIHAETFEVTLAAHQRQIVLEGEKLQNLFSALRAHPHWVGNGEPNRIHFFVTRTDSVNSAINVGRNQRGSQPQLEGCFGACEPVKVACLGDSNTSQWWTPQTGWCEQLKDYSTKVSAVNKAVVAQNVMDHGEAQLGQALTESPDVVVLAFGTNDGSTPPDQVVGRYAELKDQAEAQGVRALIALTPPRLCPFTADRNDHALETNELIHEAFGDDVVDFWRDMDGKFLDCVHLNQAAQDLRAERAFSVIRRALFE